jgi:ubiquinone/menaquinone biosynthesis C-methylase UbiE
VTVLRKLVCALLGLPVFLVALHTLIRVLRYYYKFPIPEFLTGAIDNPFRRRIQPPGEMPLRHGIAAGMRVLDVGPGSGRYTLAAAQRLGPEGQLVAVDIEPKIIERLQARLRAEGVNNVEARVADVHDLPFDGGTFDAVSLMSVIGEIPEPGRALAEFHRVLRPGGTLAFSEVLLDPDYPLARTLIGLASEAGFRLRRRLGGFFAYTLVFEKGKAPHRQPLGC